MKQSRIFTLMCLVVFLGCKGSLEPGIINTDQPTVPVRILFIHHSCGQNWLATDNGNLGVMLNANNYYVSDTNYGWDAQTNDNLGDSTNTENWPLWFNDTKMTAVYGTSSHETWDHNTLEQPAGENEIIMFKSCYPLSEVGASISDEQAVYTGLLNYFAQHTDKLFILITPPGETDVSSASLTRDLCNWLVDEENGWLKDYAHKNVGAYDFYCTLSEVGSHHRIVNSVIDYVYASDYDGVSPYHNGDDHPNGIGNQKATEEYLPLLNFYYNRWKAGQ